MSDTKLLFRAEVQTEADGFDFPGETDEERAEFGTQLLQQILTEALVGPLGELREDESVTVEFLGTK